jgi:hypothetical protein
MTSQNGEYDAPLSERDTSSPTRESLRSCALNVARSLGLVERSSRAIEQSKVSLGDTAAAARRLEELARESAALRAALRNAVWSCVIDLKAHHAPPQDVLVMVKHDVGDATRSVLQQHEADVLVADAVQWAIDAYYRAA